MKVRWTPEAEQDRAEIWAYLFTHDPVATVRIDELFDAAVTRLADYPMLGHEGEVSDTREITPHRSYRLVYQVVDDTVWVVALFHSARQWPPAQER